MTRPGDPGLSFGIAKPCGGVKPAVRGASVDGNVGDRHTARGHGPLVHDGRLVELSVHQATWPGPAPAVGESVAEGMRYPLDRGVGGWRVSVQVVTVPSFSI